MMRVSIHVPAACLLILALATFLGPVSPAAAQSSAEWDVAREHVTRAELHELMERLESQAESPAYSNRLRSEARRAVDIVRTRLERGDFRVGDRIVLEVQGEPALSDTLLVRPGPSVDLPEVGSLPLDGVLRSELQAHVEEALSRYIRNPRVRAEPLIRVSVLGAVAQPGFYVVPTHMPITDALMLAGGPAGNAHLTDLRVERGGTRIWEGEAMETAIVQGRTLDQMNIQAGDRIVVPIRDERDWWQRTRVITMVVGSVVSLGFTLSRVF